MLDHPSPTALLCLLRLTVLPILLYWVLASRVNHGVLIHCSLQLPQAKLPKQNQIEIELRDITAQIMLANHELAHQQEAGHSDEIVDQELGVSMHSYYMAHHSCMGAIFKRSWLCMCHARSLVLLGPCCAHDSMLCGLCCAHGRMLCGLCCAHGRMLCGLCCAHDSMLCGPLRPMLCP